jgi:hypothetical protein
MDGWLISPIVCEWLIAMLSEGIGIIGQAHNVCVAIASIRTNQRELEKVIKVKDEPPVLF